LAVGRISLREALGAQDRGQFGPQHLERDLAVVPHVVRQIDCGHAARAQFALDDVAVGQRGGEPGNLIHHRASPLTGAPPRAARTS
jgi:hypothetical protein